MLDPTSPPVEICYYTDPLCSWSWALEPQWRRLRYELAGQVTWSYRMGGLLVNWHVHRDPVNDIGQPGQMGPYWMHVSRMSGMPIHERIWHDDPPASSLPACLAVKAAACQGPATAEVYLRRLREAVMLEGRNIARLEVLEALAEETAASVPGSGFEPDRFRADYRSEEVRAALREDLKEAAYWGIGRFPALVISRPGCRAIMVVGYRPYGPLRSAIAALAPDIEAARPKPQAVDYGRAWPRVTAREVAEVLELQADAAEQLLVAAVARGEMQAKDALFSATG